MTDTAPATFPALLTQRVRSHGDSVFLPRRRAQRPEPITFARLCGDVDALATALLQLGIRRGDRVGLIAENRYEWLLVDLALASIGAIDVPRGVDTTPPELRLILQHSGCRMVFADDDRTATELQRLRPELPQLGQIVVMQDESAVAGTLTLGALIRDGEAARSRSTGLLAEARAAVRPDDLLTIVYTSGTTADPKGVMLTHANVLGNSAEVRKLLNITPADSFLSVLPAWHMYERIMDYLALEAGSQLVYTDRRSIKEDLAAVRPTVFAAVPRIWEMLHDSMVNQSMKLTGLRGLLLRTSLRLSRLVGGGRAHRGHRLLHAGCRRLVLQKVLGKLGGRLRIAVSGGGALPRHVDETLLGIGLPLLNGYGLTETSPVAALRLPHQNTAGHIGPPLPGTAMEARDQHGKVCPPGQTGVLWIRGPQIMRGYYGNPERTAAVLTPDGWFNSGDLGHVDAAGNFWITGRAKDTIVLSGGENIEPEPIETLIKTSPYIEQAVCVGQDQKGLGALLVPMFDALEREVPRYEWEIRDGELHGKAVHALMRRELDRLLRREHGCRGCERVTVFRVLAQPLTPENGMLTQTFKVRRHVIAEQLGPVMAAMFR